MEQILSPIEVEQLSIKESAEKLNVSTTTIRNWIKTGYLSEKSKGYISKESIDSFTHQYVGKEKLVRRANKSCKQEGSKQTSFVAQKLISAENLDSISAEYEASLTEAFRNKEGIYYTPNSIVDEMLSNVDLTTVERFLDPCCGSGNFLIQAIKRGLKPECAFGFDTDINAVVITRQRIYQLTGFDASNHIKHLDFLEFADKIKTEEHYDLIFTNPPWGKKIKKEDKQRFSLKYGAGKSLNTTSLFYFASKSVLKPKGVLSFLVQDALFNITSYECVRKSILKHQLLQIKDYNKAFKGLMTKAVSFIISNNTPTVKALTGVCNNSDNTINLRSQSSFFLNPHKIINYWLTEDEAKLIERIYQFPHQTLEGKAHWGLGIVTGNNSKYCSQIRQEDYIPIYKGSDITRTGLKNATTFIQPRFEQYQQVAPQSLYTAKEKIIYKFISSDLCFYYDKEQKYILNSANLLIPSKKLAISCENLVKMLNSDFYNWLFKALFRTHKVLRGDLELLPIYTDYFKSYSEFSEEQLLTYLGIKKDNGTYSIKK